MAEDDELDDPARAFKDMAAEVAVLRRAVEAFGEQLERVKPRNYDATLGDMRGELQGIGKRLDRIEAAPGMKITPDAFARQMHLAVEGVAREMGGKLEIARRELADTTKQLRGYMAQAATAEEQARSQLKHAGVGVLGGLVLFMALIAAIGLLPASWHIRENLAAGVMHEDRWTAGQDIARSAHPDAWATIIAGTELEKANRETIQACRRQAARTDKEQRCTIKVEANR